MSTTTITPAAASKPKSKKRKAIDPSLDFFSASFDPLKALLTPGLKPPVPDAKPLPSLLMCKQLLEVNISQSKPDPRPEREPKIKPALGNIPDPLAQYTTQFKLPQLLNHKTKRTSWRAAAIASIQSPYMPPSHSILPAHPPANIAVDQPSTRPPADTRSDSSQSTGPMSQLRRWFESRNRVVVTTRSQKSIRSRVSGFIVAFDKHWNMLLIDCDEQYTLISSQPVSERQRTSVVDANGKAKRHWRWVACDRVIDVPMQRHVGQMLIKGDTIVSVVKHEPRIAAVLSASTLIER